MSNIDWNKAPEDTTHYGPKTEEFNEHWFRVEPAIAGWSMWHNGKWISVGALKKERFDTLVSRPSEWTGEGLPPVGTELEVGFACEDFEIWHKGLCVAVGEDPEGRTDFCVVKVGKKIAMYTTEAKRMRPIRTAEQIAAEEREQAASDLFSSLCPDGKWHKFPEEGKAVYRSAIAAGWRKQVQP